MNTSKMRDRVGDRSVRIPRAAATSTVDISVEARTISVRGLTSPMSLIYGFLVVDLIGAGLLMLPISTHESGWADFITCVFTATSAITVTGLVTVDTLGHWTFFGQSVILVLIFIGGLGFMTGAAFLIILIGQELGLQNRLIVREGIGGGQLGGITTLVRNIVIFSVSAQLIGFVLMWVYWTWIRNLWEGYSIWDTLWLALFHATSAFNNAGMEILPNELVGGDSLVGFRSDYFTLLVFGVLIVIGGTGYIFWNDIWHTRNFRRLRLDTKLVLIGTLTLLAIGFGSYALGEWENKGTSGNASLVQQISDATFHSVTTRSAGFAVVDYGQATSSTDLLTEVLMFVGAASGSTGGGIKINTFMVILITVIATLRGRSSVTAFKRQIPLFTVQRALVVGTVSTAIAITLVFLAGQAQPDLHFRDVLFEVVSASSTVGLSTGITGTTNTALQTLLIFAMFLGRFGPLSLALFLAGNQAEERYGLPTEEVRIG